MKLWHVSNPANRESILKDGLVPKIGECYLSHYGDNHLGKVIFLSTDKNKIFDSTWDDDIFEIDVPSNQIELYEDVKMKYPYVYTKCKIDSKFVQCIHYGTGESMF